ncbi:hypothetical protein [Clostridium sp.]|uniref:hypothetical protein n=1 Tax=Clostridium sp. TaxID=1506 RepID=UPI0032162FAA
MDTICGYKVYGLNIKSEIEFTELIVNSLEGEYDAEICYGIISRDIKDLISERCNIKTQKDNVWFDIKDVAVFHICNGNKIIVEPYENSSLDHIKAFLLGSCMGFLLYQRNVVAIHGGTVEVNNKGIVVVGESGSGKSTLITALRLNGHGFVSDDISTIKIENMPMINPGYPGQRLCDDGMTKFGYDKSKYTRIDLANKDKYVISVRKNFIENPIEMNALCEIAVGDVESVKIKAVLGKAKIELLLRNIYLLRRVKHLGVDSSYFKQCIELAKRIPIYRITRPKVGFTVNEQIKEIEKLFIQ